jgi:hypothetical protein
MGSGVMIYIPSFTKIASGIQKLTGVGRFTDTQRQTGWRYHKPTLGQCVKMENICLLHSVEGSPLIAHFYMTPWVELNSRLPVNYLNRPWKADTVHPHTPCYITTKTPSRLAQHREIWLCTRFESRHITASFKCFCWVLSLQEEVVTGGSKKIHNEELYHVYTTIRQILLGWWLEGCSTHERGEIYLSVARKPRGVGSLGKPRYGLL